MPRLELDLPLPPGAPVQVLTDFDGTAAARDVGHTLFVTFSGEDPALVDVWHETLDRWRRGEVSSARCIEAACRATQATREELEAFADGETLDPNFPSFARWCAQRQIPLVILSDGADFYIERILAREGLAHIPFHANHLEIHGRTLIPSFPHADGTCPHCANCKGVQIRRMRQPEVPVVYIGDGRSDQCAAEAADFVFAKRGRHLLPYCREQNIPHLAFTDFSDILTTMAGEASAH